MPRAGYIYAGRDKQPALEVEDATGLKERVEFEDETQTGFDAVKSNINKFGAGGSIILNERIDFEKTFFLFNPKEGNPNYKSDGVELFNVGLDLKVTPKLILALDVNRLEGGNENSATEGILTINYRPFLNDNVILTAAFAQAQIYPNERPNFHGTRKIDGRADQVIAALPGAINIKSTKIFDDQTLHRILINLRIVF